MPKVLYFLPAYEDATYLASKALLRTVPTASSYGWDIEEEYAELATKENLMKLLPNVDLLVGEGHGDYDKFGGQWGEVVLKVCETEVRGQAIFLLSCRAGKKLGKDLVSKGAKVFVGFEENFVFMATKGVDDPLRDPIGRYFFIPVVRFVESVLSGSTFRSAFAEMKGEYGRVIESLLRSSYEWAPAAVAMLMHDADHAVMYGDGSTSFAVAPVAPPTHAPVTIPEVLEKISGPVIGGVIGFLVGGPVGALLGAVLGADITLSTHR